MKRNKVWVPFVRFYTRFRIPWLFYIGSALLGILHAEMVLWIAGYMIRVNKGELYNSVIIGYALLSVASAIVTGFQALLNDYGSKTVTMRAQTVLWRKILHLPQKSVDAEQPAQLISCITNDVSQASTALSLIFLAFSSIYAFVRACIALVTYNMAIAGYVLLAAPLAVLVFFLVGRLQYASMRRQYSALNTMTSWFSEHLAAAKYVKVRTLEEQELEAGYAAIETRFRADVFYAFASELQVILNSVYTNIVTVILAVGGSRLIRRGKMEATGINASSTYMGTVNRYLAELLTDYQAVKGTQGSLKKANHVLSLEEECLEVGAKLTGERRDIVFQNVTFGYDPAHPILKDVSFTIPAGKKTAVVGTNGSGKSTVLRLLQGFYAPGSGVILLGGIPLSGLALKEVRGQFAYVLQNTPLFAGTIRENITYGTEGEVREEEIIAAAKAADIHDYITTLPQGYDTQVGEAGARLSGGQRQRIAIARALILKPSCLILDEATASLDHDSGRRILRSVLKEEQTVLYISHSMEEVRKADHVIVLENGRLEACGTPDELWNRSRTYRTLCENQHLEAAQ